jgi:hypothetical protein
MDPRSSREHSRWKIAVLALAVVLCVAAIGGHRFLNPTGPADADPDNSSFNLTKAVIAAAMREQDKAFLSPDGSKVLIDRRETKQDLSETRLLEVRDAATFQTLGTIPLPPVPPPPPSMPPKMQLVSNAVHFCDGGKSILVYESGYTFSVIDARTYAQTASITVLVTSNHSTDNQLYVDKPDVILASSCAANAQIAVVELVFGPFGTGVTKIFDLDTGKQISEIAADVLGYPVNIDVSPSGASAAILVKNFQSGDLKPPYDTSKYNTDLTILDLNTRSVSRRILSGMEGLRVVFAGENEVAVAGSGEPDSRQGTSGHAQEKSDAQLSEIRLFDIRTGTVSQRFGDPSDGARAFVASSSDGRFLLGYTGKEWMYREGPMSYLQIDRARFTIWDRQTGKVVGQSPGLEVFKSDYQMLNNSHTVGARPTFDYSQQGNAVLVSWPGFATKRLEVFTVK